MSDPWPKIDPERIKTLEESIVSSQPIDPEVFYAQAYSFYQAGLAAEAAKIFQVLCARFPLEAQHWFGFGASLQENKEFEKALPAWAMTALLDPKNPYPHFHAAECAASLQQTNDALLALQEAKALIDLNHPLYSKISVLETQWRNL